MIDGNIKQPDSKRLKSDLYFGMQKFKTDGQDFSITQ